MRYARGLVMAALLVFLIGGRAEARRLVLKIQKAHIDVKGSKPSKRAVRSKIVSGLSGLKTCVKGAVEKERSYKGWLWLNFNFSRSGRISGVTATSTLTNPFIMKCVNMTVRHWTMPKGGGGRVTSSIRIIK